MWRRISPPIMCIQRKAKSLRPRVDNILWLNWDNSEFLVKFAKLFQYDITVAERLTIFFSLQYRTFKCSHEYFSWNNAFSAINIFTHIRILFRKEYDAN